MSFHIGGFCGARADKKESMLAYEPEQATSAPRKSVVQVYFAGRGVTLSYYNDQFDLKMGDFVYVDGKLEGELGRVTDLTYNFKIKISEYKKVIAAVDTQVHGQLFMAGSHFVAFDPKILPKEQITMWFKAPHEEDEYVTGTDDTVFSLDDLKGMNITSAIAERGQEYYTDNRVRYLCLDGTQGYAIVEGKESYTVEFEYREGKIGRLICDCLCGYNCKHEFAAMLQLRETLQIIDKHYREEFEHTGYFAAIVKGTLFAFAVDGREKGGFTL